VEEEKAKYKRADREESKSRAKVLDREIDNILSMDHQ
jgi:hypothetical protein